MPLPGCPTSDIVSAGTDTPHPAHGGAMARIMSTHLPRRAIPTAACASFIVSLRWAGWEIYGRRKWDPWTNSLDEFGCRWSATPHIVELGKRRRHCCHRHSMMRTCVEDGTSEYIRLGGAKCMTLPIKWVAVLHGGRCCPFDGRGGVTAIPCRRRSVVSARRPAIHLDLAHQGRDGHCDVQPLSV